MKRIIVAASMLAFCFSASAQDYKPVAGDLLAEIGLNFSNANITSLQNSTFGTPQLKFRYFLQDKLAIRVGFNATQTASNTKVYEIAPGTGEGSVKLANSLFGLNAGIEKHFSGTERLSTYVGADGSLQFTGASEKWENSNGAAYVNGQSRKTIGTNANGNGSFGIGARLVTGADYYFVQKVYLGAEFGWGFMATKNSRTKTESTAPGGAANPDVDTKSTGGRFELAPAITAAIRIGYRF